MGVTASIQAPELSRGLCDPRLNIFKIDVRLNVLGFVPAEYPDWSRIRGDCRRRIYYASPLRLTGKCIRLPLGVVGAPELVEVG